MERREHDIFMAMLANPTASFDTMVTVGLNSSNTSLQDRSIYMGNKYVQEQFKNSDGDFDKKKFEQAYTIAKSYYNNLANADFNQSMQKQTTWHRDSLLAPEGQRETGPRFQEFNMSNPMEQIFGFGTLGKVENPTKSLDELAQSHKVLANPTTAGVNLENAKWEDAPNDNFFGNFFNTLVIAQWDEDGEHIDPITGEKVKHEKGEPKLNQDGEYYYEKLDGRDVYGRRVLNKMNVLTRDGSFMNKFDFFDSDDIEQKSVVGTTFKNLALVGSMFIPYVGPWIAGLSVATQLAGLGATLGKMALGSDSPILNDIEGWSKSVNRQTAKSQYAQEHTWCWENFIDLIGDTMGQLKEQRFIFEKIPAIVKGTNLSSKAGETAKLAELESKYTKEAQESIDNLFKSGNNGINFVKRSQEILEVAPLKAQAEMDSFIKGYNKLGEILSKGYMTGITVADTYGEAKNAGASDLDATLLTLGYAAGEYALLNTGIGEWILPELRADKYKVQAIKKALLQLDSDTTSLLNNASREAKQSYVKRLFNIGKGIANAEYANGTRTLKATLAAGAGEGIEEVSEEVLADFSKACFNTVQWLSGDKTRLNAFGYNYETGKFDTDELLDRYGMSLIGGAVGGALTNVGTSYKTFKGLNSMTSEQAIQELVYMHRNGTLDKFEESIDKQQLANPNNSATDFEIKDNTILYAPGTQNNNQDLYAKKALHQQVKIIKDILDANGANLSDDSVLQKQTELLGDLRFNALHKSTTAGGFINEFNKLSSDVIKLTNHIHNLENADLDTNNDGVVTDKEKRQNEISQDHKEQIKSLKKTLAETKTKLNDLIEGKRSYEFVSDSLFEMTTDLSGRFTAASFPLYVEAKYHKKYSELTENEKAVSWEEYKNWKSTEGRDKIRDMAAIYRTVSEEASKVIKKHADEYLKGNTHIQNFNNLITRIFNSVNGVSESDWLFNAQNMQNSTINQVQTDLINQFGSEQDKQELQAIVDTANSIDPTMSVEERRKEQARIEADYASKQADIILNNLPNFIQSFINSGTINTETKNQLLNTLNNLQTLSQLKKQDVLENPFVSEEEINYLTEKEEQVNKAIEDIEKLGNTSFEKNLNEFSIAIGNDPINITQLLERLNQSFNDVSSNITRFNMDEQLYKDLDNAIHTIEMYQAAIKGARTDNAGSGNYFGYNATLNEIAKKSEGDFPELAEIDKQAADIFIADINTNLSKLLFLKQLYQINQGQKLSKQDRVAEKKDMLFFNRIKSIVSVPDDDPLNKWNGFLKFKDTINSARLHNQYQNSLQESDREEFEKENLMIEDAIYDFFQENQDKLTDINKLTEFINAKHLNLFTEATEILNEGTEVMDDNATLWWIASRAAVKASAFYNQFSQIIDEKIAPVATQELAVYNNYANIVNGNIFTAFIKAARQSMLDTWKNKSIEERKQISKQIGNDEYISADKYVDYALNFLPVPRYSNVVLTEGIAGSGKTSSVFKQTVALLKQFNPDILKNVAIVHGAAETSAVEIQNLLDIKNSKTYDKTKWMKEVSTSWKEYIIDPKTNEHLIAKTDYCFSNENEIRSALGINQTDTPPSLVIIDEISKFSTYDLDLINDFAKKYGITVLTAGDFDQTGVVGQHPIAINGETLKWHPELSRTSFVRSPKLGVSMRTDNSLKTRNQQKLQAYMQNPTKDLVKFEWFQDETGLYGDKVIAYEFDDPNVDENYLNLQKQQVVDYIIKQVDGLIKTLESGEKIGYIFKDKSSPIYQKLASDEYKNYIDLKEGGSAQGLEGRYYIIEAVPTSGLSSDNIVNKQDATNIYLREIYTGITRAQQGSILIMPDQIGPSIGSKKVSQKLDESINPALIKNYALKRKSLFDKITTKQDIPFKQRDKEDTKVIKATETKNGLDSGVYLPPLTPITTTTTSTATITPDETPAIKTQPETVEFSTLSAEDQKTISEIQERVIKNPETKDPWDSSDTNSLYPYGQIVSIQGEYGVIKGIKLKSNGNHQYLIETEVGDKEIEFKDITQFVSNSKINTPIVLDHQEMVNRFGDIANIESIKVNYNGINYEFPLCQIPFINIKNESGTNNMINYYHRNIVVVKIGDFHMPFYMSTGLGGKENVQSGLWYPFFGIEDGWINKGSQDDINAFYGSPILQAIAEQLNNTLGTGYTDEIKGPVTVDEQIELPQIKFINQDLNPHANHKVDTKEKVKANIDQTIEAINKAIEGIIPEVTRTEAAPLSYEDNEAPVNFVTDVIDEKSYQNMIDMENEQATLPESQAEENGQKISINMLLHSFNTFETGVLWDDQGNPIPVGDQSWSDARIDSVNGLVKLDKFKGKKKDFYLNVLGLLRSHLFNIQDKAELAKKVEKVLGLNGIYITFALKSSPRPGANNKANGREFVENNPSRFSKGISETTEFNGSSDTRSHEWHPKSLVAIIGTKANGDVLEMPLLALSSPLTLLQLTDSNGTKVFQNMSNRFETLKQQGVDYYEIANTLIDEFKTEPAYHDLINLLKLFVHTDRNIQYVRDPNWTIAKDLSLEGALFASNRGLYQGTPGFDYDADSKPEQEWTTLDSLYEDTQRYITQQVFSSINDNIVEVNGTQIQLAKPGHAFVLVSYDRSLNTDKAVVDYYIKQCADPSVPKKVTQMYVIPPKASIQEYFENLHKILNSEQSGALSIGQFFTSFKLLNILLTNDTFKQVLEQKTPGLLQRVQESLKYVQEAFDATQNASTLEEKVNLMGEVRNRLFEPQSWADLTGGNVKPVKLAGLLDGALMSVIYNRNTLKSLLTDNWKTSFELDRNNLQLVEGILNQEGIDGVYYNIKIPKNAVRVGPFVVIGNDHQLYNKPFKVHNKLDSYTFSGDMSTLVENYVNNLRPSKPDKNGTVHYAGADTYRYMKGLSDINNAPKSKDEIARENIQNTFKNKGLNFDNILASAGLTETYKNNPVEDTINKIIDEINQKVPNRIAFTINEELFISDKVNELGEQTFITDSEGNPITNLTPFFDNFGTATFKIRVNGVDYLASYNDRKIRMTPQGEFNEGVSQVTLSINEDNFVDYISNGKEALYDWVNEDGQYPDDDLWSIFNATSMEEVQEVIDNMSKMSDEDLSFLTNYASSPEFNKLDDIKKKIVNEIIALEQAVQKRNYDETQEACKLDIIFNV